LAELIWQGYPKPFIIILSEIIQMNYFKRLIKLINRLEANLDNRKLDSITLEILSELKKAVNSGYENKRHILKLIRLRHSMIKKNRKSLIVLKSIEATSRAIFSISNNMLAQNYEIRRHMDSLSRYVAAILPKIKEALYLNSGLRKRVYNSGFTTPEVSSAFREVLASDGELSQLERECHLFYSRAVNGLNRILAQYSPKSLYGHAKNIAFLGKEIVTGGYSKVKEVLGSNLRNPAYRLGLAAALAAAIIGVNFDPKANNPSQYSAPGISLQWGAIARAKSPPESQIYNGMSAIDLNNLGNKLTKEGRYALARKALEKSYKIDPYSAPVNINLGDLYGFLAEEALKNKEDKNKIMGFYQKSNKYYNQGIALLKNYNNDLKFIKDSKRIINVGFGFNYAYIYLYISHSKKDKNTALYFLNKASRQDPNNQQLKELINKVRAR